MSTEVFIVIAKPNQERTVIKGLREQGYDPYCPRTYEKVPVNGRNRPVGTWRLSPYLFVSFDASRNEAGPITNTRGVQELLCDASGRPRPLRNGAAIVLELKQREEDEFAGALSTDKKSRTDLRPGERVKIAHEDNKLFVGMEGSLAFIEHAKARVWIGDKMVTVTTDDVNLVSLEPKKVADAAGKEKRKGKGNKNRKRE